MRFHVRCGSALSPASCAVLRWLPALLPAGGLPELREAIAHYLHLSRGISCQPEQIFLCAGYPALLDWVVETLLHAGDAVWIEDPGYPVTRPLLRAAGVRPVAVPVDEQGMDVATGILTEPEARLAVVTPTHQSPLGVSLSLARRMALLDWAQQRGAGSSRMTTTASFAITGGHCRR